MRTTCCILILIVSCSGLVAFICKQNNNPAEKVTYYYRSQFARLQKTVEALSISVETNQDSNAVRGFFLQARLDYKRLEPILEYYFDGDVKYFNGPPVDFIEEEDPSAQQQPQGFQVIESYLYPVYRQDEKMGLLAYIKKLAIVANGLGNNYEGFVPGDYMPDAVMEELYRVLTLGITGFDSPLARHSLPEVNAALGSIAAVMTCYREQWQALQPVAYTTSLQLLKQAGAYLRTHPGFNSFNRMKFIVSFLNPLCETFNRIKQATGNKESPLLYALIKKNGSLFKKRSLDINRYQQGDTVNIAQAALGKRLFFEPLLSVNGLRSCGSCHQPAKGFTDGIPKALQSDGHSTLPRNTIGLWNSFLQMNLFYDSRHVALQDVVLEVLSNEKEMNTSAGEAMKKIESSTLYRQLFRRAFDSTGSIINEKKIADAITMYLRTLISYNARFDKYMRGEKNKMNADEIKGFNLFMGKAACGTCHYIPLFNGSKPPAYYYQESEVLGVPAAPGTIGLQLDDDPGRIKFLNKDFLLRAFKTPTLRNIALTAPYMHNGIYQTIDEVIEFYDNGGGLGLGLVVPNQTLLPKKLGLTIKEKWELKAFLLTLTDTATSH